MELIAGDRRIIELSQISYLGYDAADLVMPLDRVHELFLGIVHAIGLLHGLEYLLLDLTAEVSGIPVALFDRHINARGKEFLIGNELAVFKILLHAVHRGAAFLADKSGNEIVSALKCTLQNTLGVGTGAIGHVIGRKVRICAARCAKSHAEAAFNIQQGLGYVRAIVRQRKLALGTGLFNKRIVCFLQEVFKVNQML